MIVALVFVGLLLGPWINLLIDRLPLGLPLFKRPCCLICQAPRPWWTLLPLASWLAGRGRCPECGSQLRRRVLVVELALPLAGLVLGLRDSSPFAFVQLALAAYFVAIIAIDIEHRLVLNRMTGPGLAAALVMAAAGLGPSLPSALIGTVAGFLLLWVPALLLPGLGMGDVKLAAVIGAIVGFPGVFPALILGVLAGGVAATFLLISRRAKLGGTFAYAPYLVVGVALVRFGLIGHGASW